MEHVAQLVRVAAILAEGWPVCLAQCANERVAMLSTDVTVLVVMAADPAGLPIASPFKALRTWVLPTLTGRGEA